MAGADSRTAHLRQLQRIHRRYHDHPDAVRLHDRRHGYVLSKITVEGVQETSGSTATIKWENNKTTTVTFTYSLVTGPAEDCPTLLGVPATAEVAEIGHRHRRQLQAETGSGADHVPGLRIQRRR